MKKVSINNSSAGPQYQPAALLIDKMQGETLAARLDTIEKAITRLADSITNTPQPTAPAEYISRKEAAKLLRVTLPTIVDWTNKKLLTAYKIGRRVYYKPAEISAALIQKRGAL